MPNLISVADLSKVYASGFNALKNINLGIREGEILALLGPNGAGKTTLISIICGLVNPSAGSVTVGGSRRRAGLSCKPLADRARAPGIDDRCLRDGLGDGHLQPRPVRQARESRATSRRC